MSDLYEALRGSRVRQELETAERTLTEDRSDWSMPDMDPDRHAEPRVFLHHVDIVRFAADDIHARCVDCSWSENGFDFWSVWRIAQDHGTTL